MLLKCRWNQFDLTAVLKLEIAERTILNMLQKLNIKITKMSL